MGNLWDEQRAVLSVRIRPHHWNVVAPYLRVAGHADPGWRAFCEGGEIHPPESREGAGGDAHLVGRPAGAGRQIGSRDIPDAIGPGLFCSDRNVAPP